MAGEYEGDARYKRLLEFVRIAGVHFKEKYEHRPATLKHHMELVEQARKDLRSIGAQLDASYHDQLPLLDGVQVRKAVQTR